MRISHVYVRCLQYIVALALMAFTPHIPIPHTIAHAGIFINELYPKPSDEQSEWIELFNSGNESVSLNLWKLENTEGEKKSFIINASSIIQPNGFLFFPKSQTGISMSNDGDTIRLIDQNNATIDAQTFQGILGYNTSVGRTIDGAGVWTTCTTATPESKNTCPEPSPTPTLLITDTPVSISTPLPATPIDTPILDSPTPIVEIVYVTHIPTPTPTSSEIITFSISKSIGIQIAIVAGSWTLIAIMAVINTSRKKHRKKQTQQKSGETQTE